MDPLSLLPDHAFSKNSNRFAAKLTEDQRCSVLALARNGVKRDLIAQVFGIDSRTVAHIINDHSAKYKHTRSVYQQLGHDEFTARYLTEDVARMVADAAPEPAAQRPNPGASMDGVSKRANRMAGIQIVPPLEGLRKAQREIEIAFRSDVDDMPDGWYYRDIAGDDPEGWYHHGDASLRTSSACYQAANENLMD